MVKFVVQFLLLFFVCAYCPNCLTSSSSSSCYTYVLFLALAVVIVSVAFVSAICCFLVAIILVVLAYLCCFTMAGSDCGASVSRILIDLRSQDGNFLYTCTHKILFQDKMCWGQKFGAIFITKADL